MGVDLASQIIAQILLIVVPCAFVFVFMKLASGHDYSPYLVLAWAILGIGIKNSEFVLTFVLAIVMTVSSVLVTIPQAGEVLRKLIRNV
ncbi:hypothetical protein P9112_009473 [Eukaryota sp. TZLM1-RC]